MQPKSRTPRKLDANELLQYALNLLKGRALSSSEVRSKLQRKTAQPEYVDTVMARLKELRCLDDNRFAEAFASARRDSGSFGKMRVLKDLRQRRVAGSLAQKAVDNAFEDVDESGLVERWLERKYRNVRLSEFLQDQKNLASAYRKLRYAGFSSSASIRALKKFAAAADELSEMENEL
jgi:regulatory protein